MQKITQYLNKDTLGWVIIDSLPRARVISLMNKLHIQYKGIRMESLAFQELAYGLAKEAFSDIGVMDTLIRALNEVNAAVMEMVFKTPESQVDPLMLNSNNLFSSGKMGRLLWALVSDTRPRINECTLKLVQKMEEFIENDFSVSERAVKGVPKTYLAKKQMRTLLRRIQSLERLVASGKQLCEALDRENKRLNKKNIEQQAMITEQRRLFGKFAQEKGMLNKEAEKNKNEILRFSRQVAELKNEMAVGPKMRLKAALQRLQKENNGLNYMLEKERRQTEEKMLLLEKELLRAKQDIEGLARSNAELSAQIEAEQQRCASLQRECLLASVKKEAPLPKEKGRRVGIFIDNQNVYYSAKAHFGKKLDFQKFLPTAVKGRHLVKAICYIVTQPDVNQENFISMLKNNRYTVRTRELIRRADGSAKGNWDIGIAADVITMVEKNSLDVVVLVTCDGDFVDLVRLLSAKGVRVEVAGFPMNTAMALKAEADEYYFITEDLMRSGDNAAAGE